MGPLHVNPKEFVILMLDLSHHRPCNHLIWLEVMMVLFVVHVLIQDGSKKIIQHGPICVGVLLRVTSKYWGNKKMKEIIESFICSSIQHKAIYHQEI